MTEHRTVVAAAFIALSIPGVHAAETVESDPVVVTASRLAETQDETLAPVSVIDREEIERRQPQSVVELLRMQPGVDVSRSGGLGGNTSVFLRGTNSDHTLVLIDGVRASSATDGRFAWRQLDPAQIERIEIVRGPRASLYGSDAIGGVIQIFTRRPEGPTASAEAGSYDTYRANVGWGGGNERWQLNAQGSIVDSDGFDATEPGTFGHDPDDDGYANRSASLRLRGPLGERGAVRLNGWHSEGEVEFDQGTQDTLNQVLNAGIEHDTTARWRQSLDLGYTVDEIETDSPNASTLTTERHHITWQNDVTVTSAHTITLGLDYYEDDARSEDDVGGSTVFDESIDNRAAFAQWRYGTGPHDVQLALRHDDHSEFGGATTGSAAWGLQASETARVTLSYGTAFKAPSLNQLFHPGFGGFFAGNPDLDPERSRTAELGLHLTPRGQPDRYEVRFFTTRIDDLIAFQGTNSQAINVDEAEIEGIELVHSRRAGPWSYQSSATFQNAEDANTGARLLRRPDAKLAVTVTRELAGGGSVTGETLLVGDRADVGGTTLGGYGIVNLSARYPLARGLRVTGRVENLFDKDYQAADGFNTPDASVFVGIRYAPGERI